MDMNRGRFPRAMIGRNLILLWVVLVSCSLPGVMANHRVSIDSAITHIGDALASASKPPPSLQPEQQLRPPSMRKLHDEMQLPFGDVLPSLPGLYVSQHLLPKDNQPQTPDSSLSSQVSAGLDPKQPEPVSGAGQGDTETGQVEAASNAQSSAALILSSPSLQSQNESLSSLTAPNLPSGNEGPSDAAPESHPELSAHENIPPTEMTSLKKRREEKSVVIGVVAGVLIVVGVAVVGVFVAAKRRRQKQPGRDSMGRLRSANDKAVFLWRQRQESGSLRQYTFEEIETATQEFSTAKLLGKGSFGDVYEGDFEGTGHCVKFRAQGATAVLKDFRKDVFKVSGISHKHVAKVTGFCDDNSYQALVAELAPNGTLEDYHQFGKLKDHPLEWRSRLRILAGAAAGVEHIHGRSIIHCHLKSSNILLDMNREAKVADYGLFKPRLFNDKYHSDLQNFTGYIDPEYLQKDQCVELDKRSDVFSFGVVLLETVSGRPAVFAGDGDTHVLLTEWAREQQRNGDYKSIVDPRLANLLHPAESTRGVIDLALSCVDSNPQSRPTMKQVRQRLLRLEEYAGNDMLRSMTTPMSTGHLSTTGQVGSTGQISTNVSIESTGQISTPSHISSMNIQRGDDYTPRT